MSKSVYLEHAIPFKSHYSSIRRYRIWNHFFNKKDYMIHVDKGFGWNFLLDFQLVKKPCYSYKQYAKASNLLKTPHSLQICDIIDYCAYALLLGSFFKYFKYIAMKEKTHLRLCDSGHRRPKIYCAGVHLKSFWRYMM